jgi:hypothetical protein
MNEYLTPSVLAPWLGMIAGEAALVAVLVRKRAFRQYPAFFAFAVAALLQSFLLLGLAAGNLTDDYFLAYWFMQPLEAGLLLCVVHEMFRHLFEPYSTLPRGMLVRFFTACAFLVLITLTTCLLVASHSQYIILASLVALQRATAISVMATTVLIVGVAAVFAIPWQSRLTGVAWGLVIYLGARTAVVHVAALLPHGDGVGTRIAVTLSFILAATVWIKAFLKADVPTPALDKDALEYLQRLSRALETAELALRRVRERPANV